MGTHRLFGQVPTADVTGLDGELAARVPTTRQVTAGTGLTGGGDLTVNRALAVVYGSAVGTAVQGNDARVVADQAAGTASIRTLGGGAQQAAPGNHSHATPLVPNPPLALAYASSLTPDAAAGNYRVCTATGDLTLNPPTNPADGQMWRLRVIASGAQRTVTLAAGLRRPTHIASTLVVPSGRRGDVGLLYESADGAWTVLAAQAQAA